MHLDEQALIFFGCLVVAVILHEISHGVVALWFGDDTAKEAGRLTLNPIPHIDPFGSIILPAIGAISGMPGDRVGQAGAGEPEPAAQPPPRHALRRPGRAVHELRPDGHRRASWRVPWTTSRSLPAQHDRPTSRSRSRSLFYFALANLFLGMFNLLPIPPLDGSSLLERVLPGAWLPHWYRFRPYGMLLLFLLVFSTGVISTFLEPFERTLIRFVFG